MRRNKNEALNVSFFKSYKKNMIFLWQYIKKLFQFRTILRDPFNDTLEVLVARRRTIQLS
jgi:hypothetical protein